LTSRFRRGDITDVRTAVAAKFSPIRASGDGVEVVE